MTFAYLLKFVRTAVQEFCQFSHITVLKIQDTLFWFLINAYAHISWNENTNYFSLASCKKTGGKKSYISSSFVWVGGHKWAELLLKCFKGEVTGCQPNEGKDMNMCVGRGHIHSLALQLVKRSCSCMTSSRSSYTFFQMATGKTVHATVDGGAGGP